MELSNQSRRILLFFMDHAHMRTRELGAGARTALTELYYGLYQAFQLTLKTPFELSERALTGFASVSKPTDMSLIPEPVMLRIRNLARHEFKFTVTVFHRPMELFFVLEKDALTARDREQIKSFAQSAIMWLFVVSAYAPRQCVETLRAYFYLTLAEKQLPTTRGDPLEACHINTAYTRSCPEGAAEIVVYRHEEWFKVFIHETFHNFGLDFSDMDNRVLNQCMLQMFDLPTRVNAYEAYSEFWAEIINAAFCGFFSLTRKEDVVEFLTKTVYYIDFERTYGFFQLAKVLDHMHMGYTDTYQNTAAAKRRRAQYRERTSVFAYFVLKSILLNDFQDFLVWCRKHNPMLLSFRKTASKQREFCNFIKKHHRARSMAEHSEEARAFLQRLRTEEARLGTTFMLTNMRMTACELT